MSTASHPGAPAAPAPDLWAEPDDRADLRTRKGGPGYALAALAVVAGAAAFFWWGMREPAPAPQRPATTIALPATEDIAQPAAPAGPQYPLPAAAEPPVAAEGIAGSLGALVGPGAVSSFFLLDQFPRRLVATVDNLGREHAPATLWPVRRPDDRFTVAAATGAEVIAPGNARRYQPWVDLLARVDAQAAADWYRRLYPLLQQAYRELGYGDRYFNDRVIEVIDLLLATPQPAQPVAVQLTEVHGPVASLQPWTRYEFADPDLEALASGQKILLRLDAAQRAQVLQKLRELRGRIVSGR